MKDIRYEFVCGQGYNRSPIAAKKFMEMAKGRGLSIRTSFMGLDIKESRIGDLITQVSLNEAEIVFVMDEKMRARVIKKYHVDSSRVVNLSIPDEYSIRGARGYKTKEMLEEILEEKLQPYVDRL